MLGNSFLANRSRMSPSLHRYLLEAKERDGPGARGMNQCKRALPSDFVRAFIAMPLTRLSPAVALAEVSHAVLRNVQGCF